MRKHFVAFLLIFTLTAGIWPQEFDAARADAPSMTEAGGISADVQESFCKGGLRRPEFVEVGREEVPETYRPPSKTAAKRSAVYRSEWDKYASRYYYNQLPDAAQEFWDALDEMCTGYLIGAESASWRTVGWTSSYYTKPVAYSNLSPTMADTVFTIFRYSNPQYYFLDLGGYGQTGLLSGTRAYEVFDAFADGAARMQATAQVKSVIDNWMAQINSQPDVLSKEKLAHDLILKKVTYDDGYEDEATQNIYNQVVYSVFCTDTTVCAGYSQAMQLLMNGAGIDCAIVTSEEHEWNIIRINGIWYLADLTWDDSTADNELGTDSAYPYFNRSEAYVAGLSDNDRVQHTAEYLWIGYLPALIYDSGATDTWEGTLTVPSSALLMPQIISTGSKVSFLSPSGGTVYYTLDGTDPSVASGKSKVYREPVQLKGITRVRALAAANGSFDSPAADLLVVPKYTVIFDANEGYIGSEGTLSLARADVLYDTAVGTLEEAKRKGYAFLGWYTSRYFGDQIDASVKVTADVTYYAHWIKVNPRRAALSSVKNRSGKAIEVNIKQIETAAGYQIRYSTNKTMRSAKTKKISERICKIRKLKKGAVYYVQARMYQKESVSGKLKYGAWSKIKSVKIKK